MSLTLGPLHRAHRARVREILDATAAFQPDEVDVALELFDDSMPPDGPPVSNDYEFVGLFTPDRELVGYACFGATPGTDRAYDLYWIAVHPAAQRIGAGSRLLDEVERQLVERDGRLLIIETSSRRDYEATRRFYDRHGYLAAACVRDFYAPGDDRVIYSKRLTSPRGDSIVMSDWQKILHQSVDTLDKLETEFGAELIDKEALAPAFDNFQMRITPNVLSTIKAGGDVMWNQYVPTVQELDVVDGVIDSLDEDADSPVPNITHRYPDRVLFLVSPVCASYCRFCTRRRKVGDPEKIPLNQYDSAFDYIASQPQVRDIILSGGDPMMLSDRRLEYIFQRLRAIPHVEIIRLGSRITAHLPERITDEFCEMVKKYHPIYMNTHFNHPAELTPATLEALNKLANAGVVLGCQTVMLKGTNDDPVVMKDLMQKLLKARVRPYYLYMADQVAGGEHFRTTVEKGLEMYKALRGWTSGLAVPHFVIDAPGGGGKVPFLPEYVEEMNEDEVIFKNYRGERYSYKQPRPSQQVPSAPGIAAENNSDIVSIQVGKKGRKATEPKARKTVGARKRKTGT